METNFKKLRDELIFIHGVLRGAEIDIDKWDLTEINNIMGNDGN